MKDRAGSRSYIPFLLVILVVLIIVLYRILGSDGLGLPRLPGSSGEGGLIDQITGSLRALGDSLAKAFSNILR
jgi:hypothetical protein